MSKQHKKMNYKGNRSVLSLAISTALLSATISIPSFAQIQDEQFQAFGIERFDSQKLFHQSLTEQGSDNVPIWRIPSLLRTQNGTLIAAADKRFQHRGDWGDIDTAIRLSNDEGKTWSNIKTILDLPTANEGRSPLAPNNPVTWNAWGNRDHNGCGGYCNSAFLIDPVMLQDKNNGRVFLAVDMFSDGAGFFGIKESGAGTITTAGKTYPLLRHTNEEGIDERWTLRENGDVYNEKGEKTSYNVVVKGNPDIAFKDLGDITDTTSGQKIGNIYLSQSNPPILAVNTANIWLMHSDDEGKSWSSPVNISSQVKKDWMRFFGVGPGVGIQTKNGNLLIPIYYTNQHGKQSTAVIISEDGGQNWVLSESPNDHRWNDKSSMTLNSGNRGFELTESQMVELDSGDIKLFMRNSSGKTMMATSKDGGYTWSAPQQTPIDHGYSQLSIIKYSKKINGKEILIYSGQSISGSGGDPLRRDGKLLIGEVQPDGEIVWKPATLSKNIDSGEEGKSQNNAGYKNGFVYSSLAELGNGNIGLAYEPTVDYTTIKYQQIDLGDLFFKEGKIFADQRQQARHFTFNGAENLEKIGDGTAIKSGIGQAQGGITVSEGTLVLDQKANDQGESKAFTTVQLQNNAVLEIKGVQNIDNLEIKVDSDPMLKFTLDNNSPTMLNVNGDAKLVGEKLELAPPERDLIVPAPKPLYGKELISRYALMYPDDDWVKSQMAAWEAYDLAYEKALSDKIAEQDKQKQAFEKEQQTKLAKADNQVKVSVAVKGKLAREGLKLFSIKGTNSLNFKLVNNIESGLLMYELGKKLPQTQSRGVDKPADIVLQPAMETLSNGAKRLKVSADFGAFATSPIAMLNETDWLNGSFLSEVNASKSQRIFAKYLLNNTHYRTDLSFAKQGENYDSSSRGLMIGGVLATDIGRFGIAMSKTKMTVSPREKEAILNSFGMNINFAKNINQFAFDIDAGQHWYKGDIQNSATFKGKTTSLGTSIGYNLLQDDTFNVMPQLAFSFLQGKIKDVKTQKEVDIHYNKFNTFKTSLGLKAGMMVNHLELNGYMGYSWFKGNNATFRADSNRFGIGKLANQWQFGTQAIYHFNPKLSFGLELGYKSNHKDQTNVGANIRWLF
ncbi:Sialidase A precursor [Phocoenobacter uteri]|uniref:exo-alpha-sialidase n=1 Tax=Phocoenobacter uteri TaxID=146806 RepID=A0A379CAB6_9PAST|nr:exo-alpha-sialidase [Phocoenobacter uteri]MDG6882447.1 hypothetical protein [Phocoenobacter uteri]SUB58607.1 Sialidase A precursor [Phocoenobacter uteri]